MFSEADLLDLVTILIWCGESNDSNYLYLLSDICNVEIPLVTQWKRERERGEVFEKDTAHDLLIIQAWLLPETRTKVV